MADGCGRIYRQGQQILNGIVEDNKYGRLLERGIYVHKAGSTN